MEGSGAGNTTVMYNFLRLTQCSFDQLEGRKKRSLIIKDCIKQNIVESSTAACFHES